MPRTVRERPRVSNRAAVLIDTNVLLDVVLDRAPWADDATLLLQRVASATVQGFVAAHAVTTVHYVVQRERGRTAAVTAVSDLLELLDVVPVDAADFQRALALELKDFEDAVQVAACMRVGAAFLVTRNPHDFKGAPVELRSAGEILAMTTVRP